MSFLRKRKSTKIKTIRSDSDLTLQKGMDSKKDSRSESRENITSDVERKQVSLQDKILRLEEILNTAETRSTPPKHIVIIRNLAKGYMRMGKDDNAFFAKAENLYKQFYVLYPLHMELMDWVVWIEASAKAKLIREARKLLAEARLLFPGDDVLDEVETKVLHIDQPVSSV
ncbi:MAG: hypothetical protein ACXAC6_03565 [Candidatus Hodarchaeales archaeon]|jgi:hypothetical protein